MVALKSLRLIVTGNRRKPTARDGGEEVGVGEGGGGARVGREAVTERVVARRRWRWPLQCASGTFGG